MTSRDATNNESTLPWTCEACGSSGFGHPPAAAPASPVSATRCSIADKLMEFSRADGVLAIRGLQAALIDAAIALDDAFTRSQSGESEKPQGDPKNAKNDAPRPKPTIAELEWILAAPDGIFVTAINPDGSVRSDLGPKFYEMFPEALRTPSSIQRTHDERAAGSAVRPQGVGERTVSQPTTAVDELRKLVEAVEKWDDDDSDGGPDDLTMIDACVKARKFLDALPQVAPSAIGEIKRDYRNCVRPPCQNTDGCIVSGCRWLSAKFVKEQP